MPPLPLTLDDALAHVDKVFGLDRVLADEGRDMTAAYYIQSRLGYHRVHSDQGCMHVALNPDGVFSREGYLAQPRTVALAITETRARDVLELGAGIGFNSRWLAAQHPGTRFQALDLMPHHVAKARKMARALTNLHVAQGDFSILPFPDASFDVVFGIETLCYTTDLAQVTGEIARVLRPGGQFIMYDPFRRMPLDRMTPAMAAATRAYEITTAVTRGFWLEGAWESALETAGLEILETTDVAAQAMPGLRRLQRIALRYFGDWRVRALARLLPPLLRRNAVAGLLGTFTIEGPGPDSDPAQASVSYRVIRARRVSRHSV
jgi:arsenite methyltransferase